MWDWLRKRVNGREVVTFLRTFYSGLCFLEINWMMNFFFIFVKFAVHRTSYRMVEQRTLFHCMNELGNHHSSHYSRHLEDRIKKVMVWVFIE